MLDTLSDKLDLAKIEGLLTTCSLGRATNELWPTIDSTNNRALALAHQGAPHGTLVIARAQTAGRGRNGHLWLSPLDTGLYISVLLKPDITLTNLPVITLITGAVIAKAIQSYLGIKVGLKWVNDLIVSNKKIGGILAEYSRGGASGGPLDPKHKCSARLQPPNNALVIGIGLNLYRQKTALPAELEEKIGFLESYMSNSADQNANQIDGNMLIASITNELEVALNQLQSSTAQPLLDQWRTYSITLGEEIMANIGDKQVIGQAIDITETGELIVKTKSGNIKLSAGEVSIRKADGLYI